MLQPGEYTKTHFEADLNAVGEVPQGGLSELDQLWASTEHEFVKITSDIGGISLMGNRKNCDFPHILADAAHRLPSSYAVTEAGLEVHVGGQLKAYNPYGLTVYYPDGNAGEGEAAYYVINDSIDHTFETQKRVVDEAQAVTHLVREAFSIDKQQGLFIPMPEVECRYLASHTMPDGRVPESDSWHFFKEFSQRQLPVLRASINPYDPAGKLQLESPIRHDGVYGNRVSFTGTAPVKLFGEAYRVDPSQEHLEKVELATEEVTFTEEDRLYIAPIMTNHRANTVGDFLATVPGCRDQYGASMPLRLTGNLPLTLALQKGIIGQEALRWRQVSAVEMLHRIVTSSYNNKYLSGLRAELRPELSLTAFEEDVRKQARQQWHDALDSGATLNPSVVGLQKVAMRAGFFRKHE